MPSPLAPSPDFFDPWTQRHGSKWERRPLGNQSAEKAKWLLHLSDKSPLACKNLRIHCSHRLQFPWLAGWVPCQKLISLLCFVRCADLGLITHVYKQPSAKPEWVWCYKRGNKNLGSNKEEFESHLTWKNLFNLLVREYRGSRWGGSWVEFQLLEVDRKA